MAESVVQTEIASLWMDAEEIIHIKFTKNKVHGLRQAMEIVEGHNRLASGEPRPILADIRDMGTGANRQARAHYAGLQSSRYKLGMAMLVKTPVQRMLGNIFFLFNSPPYPSCMFLDENKAMDWLRALKT